ncbi:MAG TPA: Dabb family protein [Bacteroidaceae bacterium]|nr:Dabb family protein [Bacteroidaceae bacterium]
MIKHNVLFKLNEDLSAAQITKLKTDFKNAIEALPNAIDVIQSIEVGFNENPEESFDIALMCEVATMEDVAIYAKHPAHIKAASIIKDHVVYRACADYSA